MNHLICYDERRRVLYAQIGGEITPEDYQEITTEMLSYPEGKRSSIIIDISSMKIPKWDRDTRKRIAETATPLSNTKVAIIGSPPDVSLISRIFISIAEKTARKNTVQPQETRFCRTEDEALEWLKGRSYET